MFRFITEPLDRWAMGAVMNSAQSPVGEHGAEEAAALMRKSEFLSRQVEAPQDLYFFNTREFRFTSSISTPWAENNVVYGKLFRAGANWRDRPSIVLLHGW